MGFTDGKNEQAGFSNDLQVFVGASEFLDLAAVATPASSAAGLLSLNLASAAAGNFFADVTAFLKRTGIYAVGPLAGGGGSAFGTAASLPGPTTVAGTSGPLAFFGGPPTKASALVPLAGATTGAPAKGYQLNSVDVIYEVDTVALSLAQIGVTDTQFANNAAPTVTNRITLGANGLPTATNTASQQKVTNVVVTTPVAVTTPDTETIVNVKLTAGAGGTAKFFGIVLNISFNLD